MLIVLQNIARLCFIITPDCQNLTTANQLIDIVNEYGRGQIVDKETRITENSSNTLDIFLTNFPDMVNRCEVIPGISDHDIPLLDVSTRVVINKKAPKKTFQYSKGNFEGLRLFMSKFREQFCVKHMNKGNWNVESMWTEFKDNLLRAMNTYIPVKQTSSRKHSLPWISLKIKRAIRKRNRLYHRAKKSKSSKDRATYIAFRAAVQSMIRRSYWTHMEKNIIGTDTEEPAGTIQKTSGAM